MICVTDCDNCKHQRPLIDGWRCCCDAFPDGMPLDFDYSKTAIGKECNNGIGFEPMDKKENNP